MVSSSLSPVAPEHRQFSSVDLGDSRRLALMLTPQSRAGFARQATEVLDSLKAVLAQQPQPMTITVQTIFLRDAADQSACERVFARHFGSELPVTNFVLQPPCGGAALALEAWAIGGGDVRVERYGPRSHAVSYDGVRWVHCGGIQAPASGNGAYAQTLAALDAVRAALAQAGSGFEHVVRTWFYLGGIIEPENGHPRYAELNRARSDFYRDIHFFSSLPKSDAVRRVYPASTGIGLSGRGVVASCIAFETNRDDVFLLPLENPLQTPAYSYHPCYSPDSPKFSRGMALVLGDYVTSWISGTASIVNSDTCHIGDAAAQTEQTIENIQRLISHENFEAHGVRGAGAGPADLAKIRVYLKRPQDFEICKAICDRRFGPVPAIYAVADICRPELLVEIEGVAFSRRALA